MIYDCVLELEYEVQTSFVSLSNKFPKTAVNYWCNSKIDLIFVEGLSEQYNNFLNEVSKTFPDFSTLSTNELDNPLIIKSCKCYLDPLDKILEDLECLDIPPVRFLGGKEYHRIMIESDKSKKLLEELDLHPAFRSVKFNKLVPARISYHLYPVYLSLEDLFFKMTNKQLDSLFNAFNGGYYQIPRRTKVLTLAQKKKIHRRTYEEHLRKAEDRIMAYIVPVLQMMYKKDDKYLL